MLKFYIVGLLAFCWIGCTYQPASPVTANKVPRLGPPNSVSPTPCERPLHLAADPQWWLDVARNWDAVDSTGSFALAVRAALLQKIKTNQIAPADMQAYGLPDSSIFFEYVNLDGQQPGRAVALHVKNPVVKYTPPDGGYCGAAVEGFGTIEGEIAVLLLDTQRKKVLQTLPYLAYLNDIIGFPAIYAIQKYTPYQCQLMPTERDGNKWGIPTVLYPHDVDGDGRKAEFLLYMYEACSVYSCCILAYDATTDQLVPRPFHLNVTRRIFNAWRDTQYMESGLYILDFPLTAIRPNGRLKFTKDVGHGSAFMYAYDIRYNPLTLRFEGTEKEVPVME